MRRAGSALVEQKVVSWLATLMGFPETASGVLESGGTMASVLGLAVARHVKAGVDVRRQGLLKAEERETDCPFTEGALTVEAGKPCQVTIAEAGARGRTVEVAPAGGGISFEFTPKSQPSLPVSEEQLRETRKLDVIKEGAELVITCRRAGSGGGCQVRLR